MREGLCIGRLKPKWLLSETEGRNPKRAKAKTNTTSSDRPRLWIDINSPKRKESGAEGEKSKRAMPQADTMNPMHPTDLEDDNSSRCTRSQTDSKGSNQVSPKIGGDSPEVARLWGNAEGPRF